MRWIALRHQDLELVPVLGQQLELEAVGDRVDVPRLRLRLEAAHHEAADLLLVVDEAVGIADHRQVGRDAGDRLGDDVEVLGRVQRHVDAGEAPELARPLPAAVDERLAARSSPSSSPRFQRTPATRPSRASTPVTLHAFDDARAAHARALRERLREVGRIRLAVAGNPHARRRDRRCAGSARCCRASAGDTNSNSMPKLFARAICRLHQRQALGRLRDVEAAALLPAGREPGLLLQRRVELDAVAAHPRRVARRARLADESRRVPRRAAGELALLEQHDVAHAELARGDRRSRRRRCRRRRRRPRVRG